MINDPNNDNKAYTDNEIIEIYMTFDDTIIHKNFNLAKEHYNKFKNILIITRYNFELASISLEIFQWLETLLIDKKVLSEKNIKQYYLPVAIEEGSLEITQYLISKLKKFNNRFRIFKRACLSLNIELCEYLLTFSQKITNKEKHQIYDYLIENLKYTVLDDKYFEMIRFFIGNIKIKPELLFVSSCRNLQITNYILDKFPMINIQKNVYQAILNAINSNNLDIIKLLIENKGVIINDYDELFKLFRQAFYQYRSNIMNYLLIRYPSINFREDDDSIFKCLIY